MRGEIARQELYQVLVDCCKQHSKCKPPAVRKLYIALARQRRFALIARQAEVSQICPTAAAIRKSIAVALVLITAVLTVSRRTSVERRKDL